MDLITKVQHKIPKCQWIILRDMYRIYWPRHILAYYTLKTYIEWMERNPELDVNIFTSDENWKIHGTYVLIEYCGPRCNVLFNTLNPDKYDDLLLKAFENIPIHRPFTLAAFVDEVGYISNRFIANQGLKRVNNFDSLLYYLPRTESLQLRKEMKEGYCIKKLSIDDVQVINDLWPNRNEDSNILIENIIRFNMTLGVYEETSGELRGWIMQEQIGTIGNIQVVDSCEKEELREQLLIHMAIMFANAGMDAAATIMATHRPLRKLFHKLGFKIIRRVAWQDVAETDVLETLPNDKSSCTYLE